MRIFYLFLFIVALFWSFPWPQLAREDQQEASTIQISLQEEDGPLRRLDLSFGMTLGEFLTKEYSHQAFDLSGMDLNMPLYQDQVLHLVKATKSCISINQASEDQLMTLKGIGPSLAKRIIESRQERPFLSLDDLKLVKGIGPKLFLLLKDKVCL